MSYKNSYLYVREGFHVTKLYKKTHSANIFCLKILP